MPPAQISVPATLSSPFATVRRLMAAYPGLTAFALLLVWTCLVRLPFLYILHDDEAFYSAVASRWLRGEVPYATSFDVKTPGIFAIFAVIQSVFGVSLYVIKGTEIVFTALGAYGLYQLLARHGARQGSHMAAVWAAFLYPPYSLTLMSIGLPCEIIQAAMKIWAFVWIAGATVADNGRKRLWLAALSGLMIGCAVTLKQTAVFEGAVLTFWIAWQAWKRREVLPLTAFVIMGAAPALAFIAYFAITGHLDAAYTDVIRMAFARSQLRIALKDVPWYMELPQVLSVLPYLMMPIAILSLGVVLAAIRRKRLTGAAGSPVVNLGLIWYAAAMAGLLVNREPAAQYVTTLVAPSILLFALVLCEGVDFPARKRRLWIAAFALIVACQPLLSLPQALTMIRGAPDYRGLLAAKAALRANGVRPGDDLLVLSRGHYLYVMTGTLPRERYFNAMHLLCDFPTPDADPIEADFAAHPRYVVLSDPTVGLTCAHIARMRQMQAHLARDYTLMDTVHGSWDSFLLYRRKDS